MAKSTPPQVEQASKTAKLIREIPVLIYPFTMSETPLIRGKPGTSYNTVEAIAMRVSVLQPTAKPPMAADVATKADTKKVTIGLR